MDVGATAVVVLGFLCVVRCESSEGTFPSLVTRGACGGTDSGFGTFGGCAFEIGNVWVYSVLASFVPRSVGFLHAADLYEERCGHHLYEQDDLASN